MCRFLDAVFFIFFHQSEPIQYTENKSGKEQNGECKSSEEDCKESTTGTTMTTQQLL